MIVGNVQPTFSLNLSAPFRSATAKIYEILPFTRKGAIVLIKGRPAVDTGIGEAALTAVKFRENISPSSVEPGRFYLLASQGDPWAQRTLIAHGLAGLRKSVGLIYSDGYDYSALIDYFSFDLLDIFFFQHTSFINIFKCYFPFSTCSCALFWTIFTCDLWGRINHFRTQTNQHRPCIQMQPNDFSCLFSLTY
jgi:hypothetical protein